MQDLITEEVATQAGKLWLALSVGAVSMSLAWPVALLRSTASLDNAWMVARNRAQQAGVLLADAVSNRQVVGQRPVSLYGYSFGAAVIFYCLQELSRQGCVNTVQHACLMGLPETNSSAEWRRARCAVSGRLVNVYSSSDWVLGFLYRYMEFGLQVAGLKAVDLQGVENVEVSGVIRHHRDYPKRVPDLMALVGFD
eukprot:Cvel_20900.t2-p1 / transcript=Cvel_20900.t2 / gene=Cvel_20900 / organism=Chromera_velia_CCMP2878 / gene_product=hypothetical protein / transcript_product=hypothetical protein / location=Cvel_scaffold1917:7168-8667(-) / protein_length=195 / sequence_SO=supercontig / SO=protein_coding / is_pseudo=false